jgi:hypothetical protein
MVSTLIFFGGIMVGNVYQVSDLLCPIKAEKVTLGQDFISKDGILFPEGVTINLRNCLYMQRFHRSFAIEHQVDAGKPAAPDVQAGFSLLEPTEGT